MLFQDNPFALFGVHSTDSAAAIEAALAQRLASSSAESRAAFAEAAHWLLQMEHRAKAEYFWPVGRSTEDALLLVRGALPGAEETALTPRNHLLAFLNSLSRKTLTLPALLAAEENFSALSPLDAVEEINQDRARAGFPAIEEPWMIEECQQELMLEIGDAAIDASRCLPEEERRALLIALAKQGRRGMLYTQLLSAYEADTAKERAQLENDIDYALMISGSHEAQGLSLTREKAGRYLEIAAPLYAMSGCWVLRGVFVRIRNRAIDMGERHGKAAGGHWLSVLEDLFAFVPAFRKEMEEDRARLSEGKTLIRTESKPVRRTCLEVPKCVSQIPQVEMEKGDRRWRAVVVVLLALAFLLFW